MSELLWREYNVAMPEVDIGDDVFVIHHDSGRSRRLQVKTASGRPSNNRVSYQLSVSYRQLIADSRPPLVYVFAMRVPRRWHFLAIDQPALRRLCKTGLGSVTGDSIVIVVTSNRDGTDWRSGSRFPLDSYVATWRPFPQAHSGRKRP